MTISPTCVALARENIWVTSCAFSWLNKRCVTLSTSKVGTAVASSVWLYGYMYRMKLWLALVEDRHPLA